jgi:hypothetical protein
MYESFFVREWLRKIHLGSVLAALVLFFVPWLDVRCSGEQMMSQNGVQVIYGGASAPLGVQAMMQAEEKKPSQREDEAGIGWLTGIAFLSLLAAAAWAFYDFRLPSPGGTQIVGNLCALALIFLLLQLAVGFPIEKAIVNSIAKSANKANPASLKPATRLPDASNIGGFSLDSSMRKAEAEMEESLAKTEKGLNAAMAMALTVDTRFWFFLELLALSIPTGLRIRAMMVEKPPVSVPFQPRPLSGSAGRLDSLINRR